MEVQSNAQQILIVDDDVSVRRFLTRGLGFEGYRTLEAESGVMALSVAATHSPDLVILDVMLPGIDGFEVLQRLRAGGLTAPVIFLSGNDEPETKKSVLASSAADYIVKPVEFETLLGCINRLLKSDYSIA
jgi:two-component system, OmpR family, response regulator MprA